ncbi:AraC family transcriptional regulator [Mucilaginibacter robiniae]|uniref:AraC family transcriptional regulator n=1 Tax=Mucilaginibacter robiniae TaxID=2728022 RepID=A0A7L5E256_9SPHI|nr:helix-turn-helix domain-containing protein [Mucilaginibacter robiniae]QJD97450.1 AraC family transcriptional regulator [Mucilaginibacter robiniae]
MQYQKIESPEELRDTIQSFWYTSIDFEELPSGFEILPDGYVEIVFLFGSPCSISTNEGLQLLPSPFLMGLLGQPVLLHAKSRVEVVGIKCFPWTVFDLLGLPSGKGGVRIFTHPIAELEATLNTFIQAGEINEALAHVKNYFLNKRLQIATNSMLFKAGVAMREKNGTLPVSQVAAAAHATIRTLERKFKQSSGYTVKDVSGLMRFEQIRNHLWFYPDSNLVSLAHELGYTDQAHLSREFKRYSGATPAAFARKVKSDKQAISKNFVAFIQA